MTKMEHQSDRGKGGNKEKRREEIKRAEKFFFAQLVTQFNSS